VSSESPPLSGDHPQQNRSNDSSARRRNEMLRILLGGFTLQSEFRENIPDLQSGNE
jgi:hypothetical protein